MAKMGKKLSEELAKLAKEAHTILNDGTPVTKEQVLAELIWKQALGWDEKVRDECGNLKEIHHPPVAWCAQFLYERCDGKAPMAEIDQVKGIKASERIRDLSRNRLNALVPVKKGPPVHSPK